MQKKEKLETSKQFGSLLNDMKWKSYAICPVSVQRGKPITQKLLLPTCRGTEQRAHSPDSNDWGIIQSFERMNEESSHSNDWGMTRDEEETGGYLKCFLPTQSDVKHRYWERVEGLCRVTPPLKEKALPKSQKTSFPTPRTLANFTSNPRPPPRDPPPPLPLPLWLTCPGW